MKGHSKKQTLLPQDVSSDILLSELNNHLRDNFWEE